MSEHDDGDGSGGGGGSEEERYGGEVARELCF